MQNNNESSTDLSAGDTSQEDTVFAQALLSEQQQKALYRRLSFIIAWAFSALFFLSVISFSWGVMFCPKVFLLAQAIYSEEIHVSPKNFENTKDKEKINSEVKNSPSQKDIEADSKKNNGGTLFNQFLIMLALLSAVGTTLAIAVMRFSFSNEKSAESDSNIPALSPIANSLAELITQIADLIKNR